MGDLAYDLHKQIIVKESNRGLWDTQNKNYGFDPLIHCFTCSWQHTESVAFKFSFGGKHQHHYAKGKIWFWGKFW